jgi:citrate lyase gamma subunit
MLFMKSSDFPQTKVPVRSFAFALLVALSAGISNRSLGAVAVLTHHNDLNRSGANLNETLLATNNVNTNQFGKLFTRTVDDEIHTQPLIVTNVNVPGKGIFNLVIVATVSNSVYAFDADAASNSAPIWKTNFLSPGIVPPRNTDMTFACSGNYKDFAGNMGIVGTPVIDPATSTLYLVSRTKEAGPSYPQRLWALDVSTGTEVPNGHVIIGFTDGSAFNGQIQNQRAALALVNGYVYITWSSHCDGGAYHGFIAAYNATNLALPPLTHNVTPGGNQAGIWMSDQAPPADAAGNIYLTTGNGSFNGTTQFGESFLRLTNTGTALSRVDWFTPYDWNTNLNAKDLDLGSGGVLLIPGTSLLFSGGKAGRLYLVNATNMGHIVAAAATSDTNIVQSWDLGSH